MNNNDWNKQRVLEVLRDAGVNPTSQRVEIGYALFSSCAHLSAEEIMQRVNADYPVVSKATVYNTLGLFAGHALVREVIVEPGKVFYDPNVSPHHHFYYVDSGDLVDIPASSLQIGTLPDLPPETEVEKVEVVIRLRQRATH
ncbi:MULTISPECIES: Fur family transcriptional regulator [Acidithiobacillus]|jgi:Fur family iron response transcriptional regulator|uniref:Ferric uptake regulation protein n=4 Tax=Acidithiobacillus TaxID=119977 RepID=A0A2W1K097_ACIFR|nr:MULTISPECIES: Fur family transcriptional regulator [Acidithiobacillus]EGQ63284.1 Fur family ferric uptake regulator [Acidithiobacillus sp. GGI-221]ACH83845.1 ferric uptake regulator, Fur family [Acidithiobacillus ferrooxidans ATCC 53993]MBN6743751.1 transcriptional repressor [Acidithiobacillus sp. MC2.2]MBN6746608.1 transcriptional repressor [Acidithiobacillus sp. PG05]MBU2714889.1 transcriptional repressor [Acidithiobacillus ferridurans]